MKTNLFILASIAAILLACTVLMSDGMTYLGVLIITMTIIGLLKLTSGSVMKMTRWARGNPRKAQVLITCLQLMFLGVALVGGKNFRELGYELSMTSASIFSGIVLLGFLLVPFFPKRASLVIPVKLFRQRLVYLGMLLSTLVMAIYVGNSIEDHYPTSPLARALISIDQTIIPTDQYWNEGVLGRIDKKVLPFRAVLTAVQPNKSVESSRAIEKEKGQMSLKEMKKKKKEVRKRLRRVGSGAVCAIAVVLILFLLLPLFCGGVCLLGYGIAAVGTGASGLAIGGITAGPIVAGLSLWGMIALGKSCGKALRNNSSE